MHRERIGGREDPVYRFNIPFGLLHSTWALADSNSFKASSLDRDLLLISNGIRCSLTTAVANRLMAAVILIPNDSQVFSNLVLRSSSILTLNAAVAILSMIPYEYI